MTHTSAQRLGAELADKMRERGMTDAMLARATGKTIDHVRAILAGYPNSRPGTTMLDTVDAVAEALGARLTITGRP